MIEHETQQFDPTNLDDVTKVLELIVRAQPERQPNRVRAILFTEIEKVWALAQYTQSRDF